MSTEPGPLHANSESKDPTLCIEVSAVMPCLNEENTLATCIEKAFTAFRTMGVTGEVVVADNGSTDRSVAIAESLGARVVTERRKGYGSALIAGVGVAKGRVIVMADADESYDWLCIGAFVKKINEGYDLVMGNRFKGGIEKDAMPLHHRYFGNPVLSGLARKFYKIPIGDFHCGMRAFTKDAFQRMGSKSPGMEFATEMVVNAAHAGLRITEIPTSLHRDKRGRPPHLHSFRDGWRHLRFILTYAPDVLYFAPGSFLFTSGIIGTALLAKGPIFLWGFPLGIHFLALASLLTLLGLNLIGFGALAKLINSRRNPFVLTSGLFGSFIRAFTLERGLLLGLLLILSGLAADIWILTEWISRHRGAMADTVHQAFASTTVIVSGLDVLFGSFLFRMLLDETSDSGIECRDHN